MEGLKSFECSDCRQKASYWCVDCLAYWCEEGSKKFHNGENSGHKIVHPIKKTESLYDKWKELNSTLLPSLEKALFDADDLLITLGKNSTEMKKTLDSYFESLL